MARHNWQAKHTISTIIFLCLITYFCYHSIKGDRGILAFVTLDKELIELRKELDLIKTERTYLEHKVNLLKPNSLDLDLLEEQIRKNLGYAKPNEVIYLQKGASNQE